MTSRRFRLRMFYALDPDEDRATFKRPEAMSAQEMGRALAALLAAPVVDETGDGEEIADAGDFTALYEFARTKFPEDFGAAYLATIQGALRKKRAAYRRVGDRHLSHALALTEYAAQRFGPA